MKLNSVRLFCCDFRYAKSSSFALYSSDLMFECLNRPRDLSYVRSNIHKTEICHMFGVTCLSMVYNPFIFIVI